MNLNLHKKFPSMFLFLVRIKELRGTYEETVSKYDALVYKGLFARNSLAI
jgi:hypothetical protein